MSIWTDAEILGEPRKSQTCEPQDGPVLGAIDLNELVRKVLELEGKVAEIEGKAKKAGILSDLRDSRIESAISKMARLETLFCRAFQSVADPGLASEVEDHGRRISALEERGTDDGR